MALKVFYRNILSFIFDRIFTSRSKFFLQYPWAISLHDKVTEETFCSGSIISSRAILTAAHCFFNRNPNDILLYFGYGQSREELEQNGFEPSEPEFIRTIDEYFNHPRYKLGISYYDVAVVTFRAPVVFSSKVRPICFPTQQINEVHFKIFLIFYDYNLIFS